MYKMRDMMKTVESIKGKGYIPDAYDLVAGEMDTIYKMFQYDPFDAISTSFDYGFVLGARAQKAGRLQKKSTRTKSATKERSKTMTAKEELLNYVMNLSDKEINYLASRLDEIKAVLDAAG